MKIELKQQTSWKKWLTISFLIILFAYAAYTLSSPSIKSIESSNLTFQTVESGALDIYINAYGEFVSAKESLLTAPAVGKVSKILVRPGTKVTPDSIILHLFNPILEREVDQARGQLAQQKAQRQAFKYEQINERLTYQGRIADIEADLERAQLESSVNESLLKLGSASKIELQRAKLSLKQESRRLKFEKEKYKQFIEMQSHQLTQRDITITQQEYDVVLLAKQLDDMHVKAGIAGSLQTLEVELGQSVQLGESLAKVGSEQELIARIRLPQQQADQIDINAKVSIDTQKGMISAYISRIESVVTNGSVLAEAVLDGELTSNARPALSISAQVFVKHQTNAVYIRQVAGLRPRSKQTIFVRTKSNLLEQREISFGELSQGNLIIKQGLTPGEDIVSTDISKYNKFKQLLLTE